MAILVTGGGGYIGSHATLELLAAGESVVVIDNLSTGFAWAIPSEVPLIVGDVGDEELVSRVIGQYEVDAIMHFAGSIVVPESVADPLKYYDNNTAKSRSVISAAVAEGVRNFIFSSTAAVYGEPDSLPVFEDAPKRPASPYGTSKLMTELMLQDASAAYDLNYVALRYFNVAGADPHGRSGQSSRSATHLIKVACEVASKKRSHIEVFGTDHPTEDGTCIRDYIHVTDLASAHLAALNYLRKGGQSDVFNCGYSQGFSVAQVVNTVKKVSERDFEVRNAPRRAGDPPALVAGTNKIKSVLGWEPLHNNLEEIISHALAWELKLGAAPEVPSQEPPPR